MGSWLWVKKNPRQLFSRHGIFNPLIEHRRQRVLRRHLAWLDFMTRAASGLPCGCRAARRASAPAPAMRRWYGRIGSVSAMPAGMGVAARPDARGASLGRFPQQLADALPERVPVICLDLPGNGILNHWKPPSVEAMADYCHAEIGRIGHRTSLPVLAMSLGAMVAVAWASGTRQTSNGRH
jgi:hypothetical protein